MAMDEINVGRRRFLVGATSFVATAGVAASSIPFISYWLPSASVQAAGGPVEVNIGKLNVGERLVVAWRGKPIWVVRRSPETLAQLQSHTKQLRDPTSAVDQQPTYAQNEYRSLKPEFLVLVGVCTHLGCAPLYHPEAGDIAPDWQGGFFCPCHGSKFDMSGRVYVGVPAPVNLEVPPYRYINDETLMIGEDTRTA